MTRDIFSHTCQNCGGELKVNRLTCEDCGLSVTGRIALPRLARLSGKDREFVETFVLAAGSLKEAGRMMGLSYPTVRARLDRAIAGLKELDRAAGRSAWESSGASNAGKSPPKKRQRNRLCNDGTGEPGHLKADENTEK